MVTKLGELLVKAKLISQEQLEEVMVAQRREGGKLGSIVVRLGFCTDQDIVSFLGMQYGVPAADLEQWPPIDASVIALIPAELANRHKVLPLQRTGNVLTLAMADPTDIFAMDDVRFHTGYNVDPVVSSEMGLLRAIEKYYGGSSQVELHSKAGRAAAAQAHAQSAQDTAASVASANQAAMNEINIDLGALQDELEAHADFEDIEDEGDSVNLNELTKAGEDAPIIKLANMVLIDAIKRGASDIHIE
ncbi:MAG TPA: hypothetical protein VNV60_05540, partial [Holophagaceae bacterium]|nr:hypothetical protein [Holophagaceae bacterium]